MTISRNIRVRVTKREFTIGNITKTAAEWARLGGVKTNVALVRLRSGRGWSIADAFFVPATAEQNVTHGYARQGSVVKEYAAWCSMKARCLNPNVESYPLYGGRGIRVCLEWLLDFESFLKDVGFAPTARHQIDRINTESNYEPNNVRWVLPEQQQRNKRNNRLLTVGHETKTLSEWSALHGVKRETITGRLKAGWAVSEAIITPAQRPKEVSRSFG